MTNGELLLDTDLAIAFFRQDAGVQQALKGASRVLVPVIVIGELLAGALQGGQPEREQARIVALIALAEVIGCDLEPAGHYAAVRDELRRQGTPIPQNDTWIAALARQHGATLASRDRHFDRVPSLRRVPCLNQAMGRRQKAPATITAVGAFFSPARVAQRARRTRPRA